MSEKRTFEEAFKKLEKIVEDFERGNLTLEEAMKKYEEGRKLAGLCHKMLQEAKKKIEVLVKKDNKLTTQTWQEN
jgi:exodeoxyribonuclease VII small subunit